MHRKVNHLIQLQELTLIRDEQKVTLKGAHTENLDKAISTMKAELPPDLRDRFERLHNRDRIVITPVCNGVCSLCGMRLPISLVQSVRIAREIHSCPNCTRMLFVPESAPRRTAVSTSRTAPRKVGISRFSSQTLMIPRLEATDKEGVIREMAKKMETEGFVDQTDKLVDAALQRETILSTTTEHGLAFPHVRGVEGGGLALVLGISPKGIPFDGNDNVLTKIFFFMVIPTAASAFYLKLLAGLAEAFMDAEARKSLLAEKDAEKLWKALVKATRSTIK